MPKSGKRPRSSGRSDSHDSRARPRQLGRKLAVAAFGLVAGLLIVEGLARVLHLAELPSPRRAVYAGASHEWCCGPEVVVDGMQRFTPNSAFQHCYSGPRRDYFDATGCVSYRINNRGYRGPDFEIEKAPGTYRVVVIGDSFTFGEGVGEDVVFPARLAAELATRSGGHRVEVINLGIPAADSAAEADTYARFASRLGADWVILQWNTNDYPASQIQKDHLRLIGAEYRDVFDVPPVFGWSRVLKFAIQQYKLREVSRQLIAATSQDAEAGRPALGAFGALARWTRTGGAAFTVLIFPELIRFDNYPYASIVDIVREYCREQGIDAIDLLPKLAAHRDRDLWVHETDHHPNPTAHAIAASALAERAPAIK